MPARVAASLGWYNYASLELSLATGSPHNTAVFWGDPDDQLSSRPASLCYPSESATLEDGHPRGSPTQTNRCKLFPEKDSEKKKHYYSSAVGDVPSNQEQHPLYPKIHIPIGNPGMYPGCRLTTTAYRDIERGKLARTESVA